MLEQVDQVKTYESIGKTAADVLTCLKSLTEGHDEIGSCLKWFPEEIDPVRVKLAEELAKVRVLVKKLGSALGVPSTVALQASPLVSAVIAMKEMEEEIRRLRARGQRLRTILRTRFDVALTEAEDHAEAASRERLAGAMREAFAVEGGQSDAR